MDLEINLSALDTKKGELANLTSKAQEIESEASGGYISNLSSTKLSILSSNLLKNVERLAKGYNNCGKWFNNYLNDLNKLESELAECKSGDSEKVVEFKEDFADLFTKVTVPFITTSARKEQKDKGSIEAKKKAFLGAGVDDKSQYTVASNARNMVKHMRMFDNTTGEEIPEDGHITLKKGETRVITVKLPTNTGAINEIVRTTAADTSNKGDYYGDTYQITTSRSNLGTDNNNPIYVNYKNNHWPSDSSLLHNNYYEWIIHADKTGSRQISQTCEYSTYDIPGWYAKAMIGLNITIVD